MFIIQNAILSGIKRTRKIQINLLFVRINVEYLMFVRSNKVNILVKNLLTIFNLLSILKNLKRAFWRIRHTTNVWNSAIIWILDLELLLKELKRQRKNFNKWEKMSKKKLISQHQTALLKFIWPSIIKHNLWIGEISSFNQQSTSTIKSPVKSVPCLSIEFSYSF